MAFVVRNPAESKSQLLCRKSHGGDRDCHTPKCIKEGMTGLHVLPESTPNLMSTDDFTEHEAWWLRTLICMYG